MGFQLVSDSLCDYCEEEEMLPGLRRVPIAIELDGTCFRDNEALDTAELLERMAACPTAIKTACPSPAEYADALAGEERDVYVVTVSDKLSGSYGSACVGKELALEQEKGKNIHIFNSLSAAAGQVAVCLRIQELAAQGKHFADVLKEGERFIRGLTTLFVLEDLENLRKSGRLSQLQSVITGILRIKLVMGGEPDGTIGLRGKALSTGSALSRMIELIRRKCADVSLLSRTLVISHCNCRERAEQVKRMILAVCPFQRTVICRTTGATAVFAGAGGIVVSF